MRNGSKIRASALGTLITGGLLVLVSCSSVASATTTTQAVKLTRFDAGLHNLSANPVIRRAAAHRFSIELHDPASLPVALSSSSETPSSVRSALATYVDDVTIVVWLVSFGAMGAWTAYNPRNTETVNIPVSDIPALFATSSTEPGVYRLRDQKHLMLVRSVAVDGQTVGAVGFVLTQTQLDPILEAEAVQLR
jgi:hypothetical protein